MSNFARNPKQIGNLIRRARVQHRWTQAQLGTKSGVRQETISLVEKGTLSPRISTLLAILAALDLEFQIAPRTKFKFTAES
ncbi:MAG: transcriptional regulator [Verrucomicrobiales bacterium]|nr:transcriptional regulator [Verrucomicrobiales bacterium]